MNEINYFIPVNALFSGDKDKVSYSEEIFVDNLSWYLKATCTDCKINVYCGVKVPPHTTVYGKIILNILQEEISIFNRFDFDTNEVFLHNFDCPKIRETPYAIRNLKSTALIEIESITSPERFMESDDISDLVVTIGGLELHLHRVILAKSSPVFKAMLFGDFIEAEQKRISLHEKSVELFIDFLSTIYPPFTELHSTRSRYLLPLYVEYQMMDMITKCEKSLCSSSLYASKPCDQTTVSDSDLEEAFDHLILAATYSMKSLQELSISFFSHLPSNSWRQHTVFDTMPDKIKCLIYAGRMDVLESLSNSVGNSNSEV